MQQKVMQQIENELKEKGIRPTVNRLLVMKELKNVAHPVSLADLEAALGFTVDKASVFRVLELFAERELVHVIEDGSRSLKYELCRGKGDHSISDQHPHFYCERCHETYCLDTVALPHIELPEGFEPQSVNYMVKGICANCRDKGLSHKKCNR